MRQTAQARSPRRRVVKTPEQLRQNRFRMNRDEVNLAIKEMLFTGSLPTPAIETPVVKRLTVQDKFAVEIRGEILW